MIECVSCHTLNADTGRVCLACGAALPRPAQTGSGTLGMTSCPAGHPVDPSWRSCPYCDRTVAAGGTPAADRSTRLEGAAPAAGPQRTRLDEPSMGNIRRTLLEGEPLPDPATLPLRPGPIPTRLEEPGQPTGRRTVLQESPTPPPRPAQPAAAPPPAEPSPAAPARRLVGVLAAPEMGPGGMVFAVRAGRTTLGADRQNDIVLAGDSEISGEHAVILHRGGTFHLTDRLSTNGTWLNNREVPANGTVQLQDRDRIRCGRTELVFLCIEPAEAAGAALATGAA